MKNGLLTVNCIAFVLYSFFIFFLQSVHANEIDVAPLINLDDIVPSYDDLEMNNIESKLNIEENKKEIEKKINNQRAFVSILNKVTAKVSNVEIASGKEIFIYDLKIKSKSCYISTPEEKPMVAAYLIIDDVKSNNDFSGWMIKALPSVSSMEHPLYDVWLEDCH
ncbi:DUF2155 domain-containing protein [Pelagibacteraceae bacterium]|nr:DUF2155 domain-containing protein [Pelagibacteraceae bacterium]